MTERADQLAGFEDSRRQFVEAIDGVPPEALTYLAPGDDYALGGLVTHVNAILRRYALVLDAIVAEPAAVLDAAPFEQEAEEENVRSTDGLMPADRAAAMATLAERHQHVAGTLATIGPLEWDRKSPVRFGGAVEPYPTGAGEIADWLTGHYLEHVPHVAELLRGWSAATATTR